MRHFDFFEFQNKCMDEAEAEATWCVLDSIE